MLTFDHCLILYLQCWQNNWNKYNNIEVVLTMDLPFHFPSRNLNIYANEWPYIWGTINLIVCILQSGCCKPPTVCGYAYVSPTVWVNPANPAADADCAAWGNDPSQLCYECSSCKAGMLGTLREQWRRANVALVIATVALIFFYVIGCSAFKNAQTEDLFRRYKWRNWSALLSDDQSAPRRCQFA